MKKHVDPFVESGPIEISFDYFQSFCFTVMTAKRMLMS